MLFFVQLGMFPVWNRLYSMLGRILSTLSFQNLMAKIAMVLHYSDEFSNLQKFELDSQYFN